VTRGKWSHVKGKYAREHTWHLAGGTKIKACDTDAMLPEGYRDKVKLNPENLFVATVASAHILSWLHVAFQMGIEVETYRDPASGVLTEISEGVYWVIEVDPQAHDHVRSQSGSDAERDYAYPRARGGTSNASSRTRSRWPSYSPINAAIDSWHR
jgi:organic hydroperoxide reductase OsmC/OhrA